MTELTISQKQDCLRAGRYHQTGKLFRRGTESVLAHKARRVNWSKLAVKGASGAMIRAVTEMNLPYPAALELEKQIRALETKMLNQLTAGYEAYRFEYWQHEASKKPAQ